MKLITKATELFGGFVEKRSSLLAIETALKEANIDTPALQYVSLCLLLATIVGGAVFLIATLLFALTKSLVTLVLLALSPLVGASSFFLAYYFPTMKAKERGRNIEKNLPYAINHMAVMAASGLPPVEIFKSLARFTGYGEVSVEMNKIVKDMEVLGLSEEAAIRRVSETAPSPRLRDLLLGMDYVIRTGGDLKKYLQEESKLVMEDLRSRWRAAVRKLGVLCEVYAILFVASPLIITTVLAVMLLIGGLPISPVHIMIGLTYIFLPFFNVIFLLMLDLLIPELG